MADNTSKPKRRLVKNPESFREKALKAEKEESEKKKSFFARVLSVIFAPFKAILVWFFNLSIIRLIRRVLVWLTPRYIKNSVSELKLVTWPTWKESRRLTYAVVVFAVIFGAAIAGVDWVLGKIFKELLLK